MAKIPEFNQPAIPSAVVGTPGLDTSPFQLGAQNLQAEGEQAQFGIEATRRQRALVDQNTEIHRQEQAHAFQGIGDELTAWHNYYTGLKKESDALYDHTMSTSIANNFELDARKLHSDIKAKASEKGLSNVDAEAEYKKGFDDLTNKYADQYKELKSNPRIASSVGAKIAAARKTYEAQMHDFVQTQKPIEAKLAFEQSFEKMKETAVDGDYPGALTVLNSADNMKSLNSAYGENKAHIEHDKRISELATSYMVGRQNALEQGKITLKGFDDAYASVEKQIPIEKRKEFIQARNHAEKDVETATVKAEAKQEGADKLEALNIVDKIKSDPTAKNYPQQLRAGANKMRSLIAEEEKKPIYKPGDPIDPQHQYQRPAVLSVYEAKRDYLDRAITENENTVKREAKQKEAEAKAAAKEATKAHKEELIKIRGDIEATQQEAHQSYLDNAPAKQALDDAMARLRAFSTPKEETSVATKTRVSTDHVEALNSAVNAFHHAQQVGAIDDPSRYGTKVSSSLLAELKAHSEKLSGRTRDSGDNDTLMRAKSFLNSGAPPALHRILTEYKGRKASDTEREFTHNMLDTYDHFKAVNPGVEPKPHVVEQWRHDVTVMMAKSKAKKQADE